MTGEKLLPDLFHAKIFTKAGWSPTYYYAAEDRTGQQFYITTVKDLHIPNHPKSEDLIKVIVKRKKGFFFDRFIVYDEFGFRLGEFAGAAGGGPPGDFYPDVAKAYKT